MLGSSLPLEALSQPPSLPACRVAGTVLGTGDPAKNKQAKSWPYGDSIFLEEMGIDTHITEI
jgi:hypothetical protein